MSQEPVQSAVPASGLVLLWLIPKHETRFSWADKVATEFAPSSVDEKESKPRTVIVPREHHRPDLEKSVDVIPHVIFSCRKQLTLHTLEYQKCGTWSRPSPFQTLPLGKKHTELMSLSCPSKVPTHSPERISHALANVSHEPDTKMLAS